jgi:hypothetical protein
VADAGVLDRLLEEAFMRGFERLAHECPHRIVDNRARPMCVFHESAPSDCTPELCPRVRRRLLGR